MRLWTSAQPAVANYIHALVRNHSDAKDILQETALVLFRRFPEYDNTRPFVAWALGFARFQALGFHRDQGRCPVIFDEEVLDGLTRHWVQLAPKTNERTAVLEVCMERLAARARQIVTLRYFENLNAEEIAHQLKAQGSAIRVALQRIRTQLHDCVTQQLKPEGRPV